MPLVITTDLFFNYRTVLFHTPLLRDSSTSNMDFDFGTLLILLSLLGCSILDTPQFRIVRT